MAIPLRACAVTSAIVIGAVLVTPALFARTTAPEARQAQTQSDEASVLLERLFAPGEFTVRGFGPARWLESGAAYTTVEPAARQAGGREIIRYVTRTGERSVLVCAAQLTPHGAKKPLAIDDYEWSADGSRVLVFTNSKPVWRDNTRGDYWVLDRRALTLRQLGRGAPASSLLFAKFSPDGTRVGYVRQHNIYVERPITGAVVQLTRDGSETTINGTTDWAYEEELSLRDGFRWSPDGKSIAYWQFDTRGVGNFPLVCYTGKPREIATGMPYPQLGTYPVIQNFPYPLAGTTIPRRASASFRPRGAPRDGCRFPATRATTTCLEWSGVGTPLTSSSSS